MHHFFRQPPCSEGKGTSTIQRLRELLPCLFSLRDSSLCPVLLLATILALLLPVVTAKIIFPAFTDIIVLGIQEDARRLGHLVLPPSLKHTRIRRNLLTDRFFAEIFKLEHDFGLLKVKIYSHSGEVLYSSNPREIGTTNSKDYFKSEVAKGIPVTHLIRRGMTTLEGETARIDVVETYVPFMAGKRFLGAFEMYYDVTKRIARMKQLAWYSTLITGLLSSGLVLLLAMFTFKDMAQQRAQSEADALKEDVERITRHDLKAPLAGILCGTDYLCNYTTLDKEQTAMVKEMRHTANTAMDLINRGLDLYRMETGKYQCTCEMADLIITSRRVVRDLAELARKREVRVLVTREGKELEEGETLFIQTDSTLLYSLLANVLKNAIEASSEGQQVTLSISGEKEIRLAVHNQEPVPEKIRDSFFDKYMTSGKAKGTGLGTYSAKLIAETLGGTISMRTSEEKGTLVVVTLPGTRPPG